MNVDGLLEALQPPKMVVHGKEYTGRYPSFLERIEIEERWQKVNWADAGEQREFVEFVCGKLDMPADEVLALPELIMTEVVFHFLAIAGGTDQGTDLRLRWSEPSEDSASDDTSLPEPQ